MSDKQCDIKEWLTGVDLERAATRYVWEVEEVTFSQNEVSITIGGVNIVLDLTSIHEKRYALGYLLGFRNPQSDIDRLIFQELIRAGDTVLDAGANIGATAAEALACGASQVLCVEPEAVLGRRLDALKAQHPDRFTIWRYALGAAEGNAELLLSVAHNQGHTTSRALQALFPAIFGERRQLVPVTTIDRILADRPADIWKLDIEGAEADAVRGGEKTLNESPPRVIIAELYDPFVAEVVDLLPLYTVKRAALSKAGYRLYLLDQIGGRLPNEYCVTSPVYVFFRKT